MLRHSQNKLETLMCLNIAGEVGIYPLKTKVFLDF